MILLYVVAAFVFFMWWVRGSIWPGIIFFTVTIAVLVAEHSSYIFDANAPHRAYLALREICQPGSSAPCDYAKTVDGSLMEALAIGGENSAQDDSLPVFAALAIACAVIAFTPHLISRHRARRFDRMINGVSFLGKD